MSRSQRSLLLAGSLASMAVALWLLLIPGRSHPAIAPELHAIAPDFEARILDAGRIQLSELRGRPVVLNFWATWCGPCRLEMPILQSIFDTQRKTGLRILAINLGEDAAAIRGWRDEFGLSYDLVSDPAQHIAALYRLRGQPSTYVITPDGRISAVFFGPVTESALLAALE